MGSWLQAAGLATISTGVGFIYWPAGLVAAGVGLLLWGLSMGGES